MNQSAPVPGAARTTRSTPSPPMPRCRSQSAATRCGVSSIAPSGSGSSTKSLPVPCPLANRMTAIMHRLRDQVGVGRVEPADPRVAAEPGPLPAYEPPGGADRLGVRGGLVVLAGQEAQHLLVAEGPARGPARAEPGRVQGPHLIDEFRCAHVGDPSGASDV